MDRLKWSCFKKWYICWERSISSDRNRLWTRMSMSNWWITTVLTYAITIPSWLPLQLRLMSDSFQVSIRLTITMDQIHLYRQELLPTATVDHWAWILESYRDVDVMASPDGKCRSRNIWDFVNCSCWQWVNSLEVQLWVVHEVQVLSKALYSEQRCSWLWATAESAHQ